MPNMRQVYFPIERETEKAFYCRVKNGYAHNTEKFAWIPKSLCKTETFVETVDNYDNPKTYGKRVIAIAEWFLLKNKLY